MTRRALVGLVEVVAWWALMVGVWVITLSSAPPMELYISAAAALPCALLMPKVRRTVQAAWRPDWRWLRWLAVLPISVVADTARVFAVVFVHAVTRRPIDGELIEVRLQLHEDPARAAAHEALAMVTVSATPGSFVVDSRPERSALLLHKIVDGRPDMQQVVSR